MQVKLACREFLIYAPAKSSFFSSVYAGQGCSDTVHCCRLILHNNKRTDMSIATLLVLPSFHPSS
jgi:hypothetical protein